VIVYRPQTNRQFKLTINQSLNFSASLQQIVEAATVGVHSSAVYIFILNQNTGNIEHSVGVGTLISDEASWSDVSAEFNRLTAATDKSYTHVNNFNYLENPNATGTVFANDIRDLLIWKLNGEFGIIGILCFGFQSVDLPISEKELELTQMYVQQANMAVQQYQLISSLQEQVKQMQALHTIEVAANGSTNLEATLDVLLRQGKTILNYDAALVLGFNPVTLRLEYVASYGMLGHNLRSYASRIGEGLAGKSALERRILGGSMTPLQVDEVNFISTLAQQEKYHSHFAAPIEARGNLKGVLQVFFHNQSLPGEDWMEMIEIFVRKIGNVMSDAEIFREKNKLFAELELAYDTMCDAWVAELENYLNEPAGHTKYLADLTIQLAKQLGVSRMALSDIYRGVMLHDIGMQRIPHNVIHKKGNLDYEERRLIQMHPMHTYDILGKIDRLRGALDIPLYHHERWDGSGYPFHFKEEQIPLPARLFAVIDVWDSMRSDRPYRAGLPVEHVRGYLSSQAGILFDPDVIEAFLKLI
jgi:HD-GYP domain-containing protein (c-di-GMP phosphodiesterase class II)